MLECMKTAAKPLTRYDQYSQIDKLAEILYDAGYDDEEICSNNPLRVDNNCPVDEQEICKETCCKCIKAWLLEKK